MQVTRDDWTPLFRNLKMRVSKQSSKRLLEEVIGEIRDITLQNFESAEGRTNFWRELSEKYAEEWKDGDRTPNLRMSPLNHFLRGNIGKQLIDSFAIYASSKTARLTNTAPYADIHQFGARYMNVPARPYYPVTSDGSSLNPYAERRVYRILKDHFGEAK